MGRYVKTYFYLCLLVAGAGLEPASALAQSILSRSSLPISPTCHIFILFFNVLKVSINIKNNHQTQKTPTINLKICHFSFSTLPHEYTNRISGSHILG